MRPFSFAACALAVFLPFASSQTPARKEPALYTGSGRAPRAITIPPGMRLALRQPRQFALAPLSPAEVAQLGAPSIRLKTGVRRSLPAHVLATGAWETTAEGARIWRIALHSPGSRGLRVEFENFSVGSGQVWLHDGVHRSEEHTSELP